MARQSYPSDLTDAQWARLERWLPPPKSGTPKGGRPRTVDLREVVNGILYLLRTGCAWRMLPHDLPPWGTVHYIVVHAASVQDRDGAKLVIERLRGR
jgi:putative transposase